MMINSAATIGNTGPAGRWPTRCVGGPVVAVGTAITAAPSCPMLDFDACVQYHSLDEHVDMASGSPEFGCSLDELPSVGGDAQPQPQQQHERRASNGSCPSGSPPGSALPSPRRRRAVVSTRGRHELNASRVAIMSAIHAGQHTEIGTALERLVHVPQVAWPLIFQSAMLTTCPRRLCSLLDSLLRVVDTQTVSEADSYLVPMACAVADAPRSLAAYELYTRVSLLPWCSGVAREPNAAARSLDSLDQKHFAWARVARLRTSDSCTWSPQAVMYELAEALLCRDRTRATQAAFALVAAGRLHHAKIGCDRTADPSGSKFMAAINSLLRIVSDTGVTNPDLKMSRARRQAGIRMEAAVYLVVASVCNRSTSLRDGEKAALRSVCHMSIKITDKNNLFSPYAMCAALITAVLADSNGDNGHGDGAASCSSYTGGNNQMAERIIPFSGQCLLMPPSATTMRAYERHDSEDLALGSLCYAEGRGPSASCWSLIQEAQFGRAENVRNFDARVINLLVPMWRQWFPSPNADSTSGHHQCTIVDADDNSSATNSSADATADA